MQELHKEKLLERLRIYFEENGKFKTPISTILGEGIWRFHHSFCTLAIADVEFEDGWRVEVKQRTAGNSAGTCDAVGVPFFIFRLKVSPEAVFIRSEQSLFFPAVLFFAFG